MVPTRTGTGGITLQDHAHRIAVVPSASIERSFGSGAFVRFVVRHEVVLGEEGDGRRGSDGVHSEDEGAADFGVGDFVELCLC